MYNPTLGRWLQVDQVGLEAGDTNLYRYAGNRPISARDPFGLEDDEPGKPSFDIPPLNAEPKIIAKIIADLEKRLGIKITDELLKGNLLVGTNTIKVGDDNVLVGTYYFRMRFKCSNCKDGLVQHGKRVSKFYDKNGKEVADPVTDEWIEGFPVKDGVQQGADVHYSSGTFKSGAYKRVTETTLEICCGTWDGKPIDKPFYYPPRGTKFDKEDLKRMKCTGPKLTYTIKFAFDQDGNYEFTGPGGLEKKGGLNK